MKNKRGFTLVELMAVIVILAIIIAIAVPSYAKIKRNIDRKNYENTISLIQTAALKYSEDTNQKIVFVDDLINAGYIDASVIKNLVNPNTNKVEKINCNLIKINEDNGMKYAKYMDKSFVLADSQECDFNAKNDLNTDVTIKAEEYPSGNEIKKENNYWTNQDVKLTYVVNSDITVRKTEWYRGYEKIAEDTDSVLIEDQTLLQQLYKIKIIAEKDGSEMSYESSYYVRIDKISPKIDGGTFSPALDEWSKSKVYQVKAHDNNSGLSGYAFVNEDEECTLDIAYQKNNKLHFAENGIKKICVKDFAGNITVGPVVTIEKIDPNTPTCEFEIIGTKANAVSGVQWYKSDVTVKLNAKNVGLSGVKLGINTTNTEKYDSTSFDTSSDAYITKNLNANMTSQKYYGYIVNQARTKNNCQSPAIAIEKEITAPVFSSAVSDYTTITAKFTSGAAISGIKETKCYILVGSNNIEGTLVGNDCKFNVSASYDNTSYNVQKCILSNAGNSTCTSKTVNNTGYCAANQYNKTLDSTSCDSSYGNCSAPCGGGTQYSTKYQTYKNVSKYNGAQCGSKWVENVSNGCSRTCGGTKISRSETIKTCPTSCGYGGGTISPTTRNYLVSTYNGQSCGTTDTGSKWCNATAGCCSWKDAGWTEGECSASCPTSCGYGGGEEWGQILTHYVSHYDNSIYCNAEYASCSKWCDATPGCGVTYSMSFNQQVDAIGNAGDNCMPCDGTMGCDAVCYHADPYYIYEYSAIDYRIEVTIYSDYAGHCELNFSTDGLYGIDSWFWGQNNYGNTFVFEGTKNVVKDPFGNEYALNTMWNPGFISMRCPSQHTSAPAGSWDVNATVTLRK